MIKIKRLKSLLATMLPFAREKQPSKLRFETEHEFTHLALPIKGVVPAWLQGTLIRNCAVPVFSAEQEKKHLFDGVAMLHSFGIKDAKISYTSRYLRSEAYAKIVQSDTKFYQNTLNLEKAQTIQDAGVNVFKYQNDYVALTESPLPVRFDLDNLETLGNFDFHDALPKKNSFESAHPHRCPQTQQIFNFLIEYGQKSHYVLYKMTENSATREVIARIPVKRPGYMHSFAMTENYLVLVEFPLVITPLRLLFAKVDSFASYIKLFNWAPAQGTRFLVVDKKSGALNEIISEPFFSFHHANAYEQDGEIIVDLAAHNLANLGHVLPQAHKSSDTPQGLLRFLLDLKHNTAKKEPVLQKLLDFPKVNDSFNGKPYRFLYMIDAEPNNFSLIKFDWELRTEHVFNEPNSKVIEPIFVPSPNAQSEDDGVIITVISQKNTSSLLLLDARNLNELARAVLPEPLPTSFHGQFF